eukprot:COSAG06_NODE_2062_length_7696_cov_1217.164407_5_plen_277_part_00
MSSVGTVVHLGQRGWEAWTTRRKLPELQQIAEFRDKSFDACEKDAEGKDILDQDGLPRSITTDEDVIEYSKKAQDLARVVTLARCKKVTDAGVVSLAAKCANIHSLTLECCELVTDEGVIAVAKGCRHLLELDLTGCTKVTDKGLIAVVEGCGQLKSLNLRNIGTDGMLAAVAESCPQLTSLELWGCWQLTHEAVLRVARGCPQLTSLGLGYTSICNVHGLGEKQNIASEKVKLVSAIVESCPLLTWLDFGWCDDDLMADTVSMLSYKFPNIKYRM